MKMKNNSWGLKALLKNLIGTTTEVLSTAITTAGNTITSVALPIVRKFVKRKLS